MGTFSNTGSFITKASALHNSKYNYTNTVYYKATEKVEIICLEHGPFWQRPSDHLYGKGCPSCKFSLLSIKFSKPLSVFIEEANSIHHFKYDYSQVVYKNSGTKIKIICSIHGVFEQAPDNHLLNKQGCPMCKPNHPKDIELFVKQANTIHNNIFIYDEAIYINSNTNVKILCVKHGPFWQLPKHHLSGSGCSKCSNIISKPETEWLDSLSVLIENRQKQLKIYNHNYKVDGFNPITNTIYEFYGDYWHGNPKVFDSKLLHPDIKGKTFGDVFNQTLEREALITKSGYSIITMWENDWKNLKIKEP